MSGPLTRPHEFPASIRFGTRGSALALEQTTLVIRRLVDLMPGVITESRTIRTEGDADKTSPLTVIGGRGVFTTGLQTALRQGTIDAAVHSAKDLPSEQAPGLTLVAFPERESPRDVLVSRHGLALAALPPRPVIGTSSRRRATQVLQCRPDARIVDLRGNIDTRIRKALTTDLDAIIVAAAGVHRMGWDDAITEELSLDVFVPAPGQGALAIEARADDTAVLALLASLDDPAVSEAVRAERAFLRAIGGGCTSPVGAHVTLDAGAPWLRAMLASEDGRQVVWATEPLDRSQMEHAAAAVARNLQSRLDDAERGSRAFPSHPVAQNGTTPDPAAKSALSGRTVLVTRAREQADDLSRLLLDRGALPVEVPSIRIAPLADFSALDEALRRLAAGEFAWTVVTSVNGVSSVLARFHELGIGRDALGQTALAAVGPATAAALRNAGLPVDLVPDQFVAEEVVAALVERDIRGKRVLCLSGNLARPAVADGLREFGALVDVTDAYCTEPETSIDPVLLQRLTSGEIDVVTFASASSVRNLVALLGADRAVLADCTVACIGPVTADAARGLGLTVDVVATRSTLDGLVDALSDFMTHQPRSSLVTGREPELAGAGVGTREHHRKGSP